MMLKELRRILNRLNLLKRLSDVEVKQLIILKRSDGSLKRMEIIMDNFEERTIAIDDMLDRMEEKMGKFEERAINIERIGLELYNMVSPKPPISLDMHSDLNRVI